MKIKFRGKSRFSIDQIQHKSLKNVRKKKVKNDFMSKTYKNVLRKLYKIIGLTERFALEFSLTNKESNLSLVAK